jgi:ketosteroid isomerase-like protein
MPSTIIPPVASGAVEVVRAYFDAWNRRDLDLMEKVLAPEVQWRRSADFPEGRTLTGRESLMDFARSMFEVFAETPIDVRECIEIVPEEVLVVGASRFLGDRSGVQTEAHWVRIYSVRDGTVSRVRPYPSREEALRAAS